MTTKKLQERISELEKEIEVDKSAYLGLSEEFKQIKDKSEARQTLNFDLNAKNTKLVREIDLLKMKDTANNDEIERLQAKLYKSLDAINMKNEKLDLYEKELIKISNSLSEVLTQNTKIKKVHKTMNWLYLITFISLAIIGFYASR